MSFFAFFVIVLVVIYSFDLLDLFFYRIENGRSAAGRFNGYSSVLALEENSMLWYLFFGHGMFLYESYLAGWIRMFYYFGIVGIVIYLCPMLLNSLNNKSALFLIIFLFALGIGTSIILSGSSIMLLSFISKKSDKMELSKC